MGCSAHFRLAALRDLGPARPGVGYWLIDEARQQRRRLGDAARMHRQRDVRERKAQSAADANTAMTSDTTSYDTRSELGAVVGWRRGRLLAAGFVPDLAARLARDCRVDLHSVLDLVDRDCPPALAARILAPLDDDPRPC
jgi:hypothetical protein